QMKHICICSGLDPAGPMFMNRKPSGRLDRSDAMFVDVIHTDSGSLLSGHFGYVGNLGHADFYPNGGSRMRGCKGMFSTAVDVITGDEDELAAAEACNHSRAHEYFIESINSPAAAAYRCSDYETFQKGMCQDSVGNVMGYHSSPDMHGTFFCDTQSKSPYLSRQVVVRGRVRLTGALKTVPGRLTVALRPLDGPPLHRSS
ncbi:Lipase/vitellogenin, partial [Trinorchestia longiramus]